MGDEWMADHRSGREMITLHCVSDSHYLLILSDRDGGSRRKDDALLPLVDWRLFARRHSFSQPVSASGQRAHRRDEGGRALLRVQHAHRVDVPLDLAERKFDSFRPPWLSRP